METPKEEPEMQSHTIENCYGSRKLAYMMLSGRREHGIFYIPGFMGDMTDKKPEFLNKFCKEHDFSFLRYDPTYVAKSAGSDPIEYKLIISTWIDDALEMFNLTRGSQIIVSHSLGGLIALHLALKHPERVTALMLLGPVYNLHEAVTTTPTDSKLMEGASQHIGYFNILKLLRDAKQHNIQLGSSLININCRVTIIHGEKDEIPYEFSEKLFKALASTEKTLTLIESGSHFLEDDYCLEAIKVALLDLAQIHGKSS
ncbi:palmitoyl-protein thioesterase ABHD10, mitochondrial-like isoform X1 [Cherax quadricarinatus]|nr:palmitoyl-protein thioesterase ABHD10, mitochondrial-like isoform X1 [Cherax quadricarinatus]